MYLWQIILGLIVVLLLGVLWLIRDNRLWREAIARGDERALHALFGNSEAKPIHEKSSVEIAFHPPSIPVKLLGVTRNARGSWGVLDSDGVITGDCPSPEHARKLLEQNGGVG